MNSPLQKHKSNPIVEIAFFNLTYIALHDHSFVELYYTKPELLSQVLFQTARSSNKKPSGLGWACVF